MNRLHTALFIAAAIGLQSSLVEQAAQADIIEIQFTGLNVLYDGSSIFDTRASNTVGSGDPVESDPLNSMTFLQNDVQVGVILTSDIFADVHVAGFSNIPVGGGLVTSSGNGGAFGFDLLTKNLLGGWGIDLEIDQFELFYSGSGITIAATGVATTLSQQDLPFGVEFDGGQQIAIVFSSTNLNSVTNDGTFLTGFRAAGTGSIRGMGTVVPEPSTIALLTCGLLGALIFSAQGLLKRTVQP